MIGQLAKWKVDIKMSKKWGRGKAILLDDWIYCRPWKGQNGQWQKIKI
jgi:hypothetical protein